MNKNEFIENAKKFINDPPYYYPPYNKKTWGNRWHSLCSYHGKLKPSIAHFLIKNFSKENDIILDPMAGVGTIPFEAALQGRIAYGNDLSKMAYIITRAKLNIVSIEEIDKVLNTLEKYLNDNIRLKRIDELVTKYKDFGLNRTLKEYFEENTFKEILACREYFNSKKELSNSECIVFSSFMHILHGNRPYALSRTSHPLTPYAPKGEFKYKSVINCIKNKIGILYNLKNGKNQINLFDSDGEFLNYKEGKMTLGDTLEISKYYQNIDIIITSPPFVSSLKFYTQNWMRLWLSGWEENDYKNAESDFLEAKQKKDISIYEQIFKEFYKALKSEGKVILHLGKTAKFDMAKEILPYSKKFFDVLYIGEENVQNVQKHGIKDKGSTNIHQFLFLQKKD